MPRTVTRFSSFILTISALRAFGGEPAPDPLFFTQRIAPLLQQSCLSCHNSEKTEGDLDLSTRASALKGGETGPSFVAGDPAQSLLIKQTTGAKPKMPKKNKALNAEQIADLSAWIEKGAAWPEGVKLAPAQRSNRSGPDFWSYQPIKRPAIPATEKPVRTPIDAFIYAKLKEKGLAASPEADRATLIRRLSYDLVGLPPTPDEIDAFAKDTAPDAYEKLVDRLLASPRYGERWGRYWLDVVHYGDTHGYDKDKRRPNAWPYRDYVIRSFNDDKPYSRFVREQIAGDVLYPESSDGVVATGFIAAGPWDMVGQTELAEGSTDKKITRNLDRDDMVANTASTFLSVTVHCARCHDHKFDPIPQKDYYALQAVFAGVERGDRPYSENAEQQKIRDALEKKKSDALARRDAATRAINERRTPELTKLEDEIKKLNQELSALSLPPGVQNSPTNGYHSEISNMQDAIKWVQVDLGKSYPLDEIRLIPARPTDFRDTPGFGFPLRFKVEISDDEKIQFGEVVAGYTDADFHNPGDAPVAIKTAGKSARFIRVTATKLWERTNDWVFALAELQASSAGKNVAEKAPVSAMDTIEAGRWSTRHLVDGFSSRIKLPAWPEQGSVAGPVESREEVDARRRKEITDRIAETEKARKSLHESLIEPALREQFAKAAEECLLAESEIKKLPALQSVYAAQPHPPRNIQVLHRGNVTEPGDEAFAGGLSLLAPLGLSNEFSHDEANIEGKRRAALANWITDPQNVLARRSIVNRIWHYHFGKGLVDSPNDFGYNGGRPTHPELLDWLAAEFLENGESIKKLHKLIVTSTVYRQVSVTVPGAAQGEKIDADNRLLWRMNRRRLDAESLRDSILSISGKLNSTMYGPGFDLFKFRDDHSPEYNYAAFSKDEHPETWRRTVYRFAVRSVPNPFLDCLDCADPNLNVPVRNSTNTALQALAVLNDPFVIRQAGYLAERLGGIGDPIEGAYKAILGRAPSDAEKTLLAEYVKKHGLANACRMLLNTNEFMFVD